MKKFLIWIVVVLMLANICYAKDKAFVIRLPGNRVITGEYVSPPLPLPEPYIWWKMTDEIINTNIVDTSTNSLDVYLHIPVVYNFEPLFSRFKPSVVTGEYSMYYTEVNTVASYLYRNDTDLLNCTNTDFTVGMWYYSTKAALNYACLIGKGYNAGWHVYSGPAAGDNILGYIYDGATSKSVQIAANELRDWVLLALTYSFADNTIKGYSNGVLIATTSLIPKLVGTVNAFSIGWDLLYGELSIYGFICQPYITYSTVSSNDILNWYTTGVVPATNTMLAYWKFTNDVYRYDDSGTNLNWHGLALSGATPSNNALYFDGVSDCATALINTNCLNTAWTKSFWLNAIDYDALVKYVYSTGIYNTDADFAIRVGGSYNSDGYLSNAITIVEHNGLISQTASNIIMPDKTNSWYNLIVTYNSLAVPNIGIYIDGVLQPLTSTNFTNPQGYVWGETIGSRSDGNFYWHGFIDDVRQWATNLTQEQITELVNAGRK
jgi:hypothetical protein